MPLDTVNDIRSMDAAGRSRSEIARVLHVSRNTVAKYADMEDMSPAAPMPQRRGRPALEGNEEWVAGVLETDLGAPRKQRHTARRIYDRLVAERGYGGSYSTVQRFVRELRLARAAAGGEGYLELEWAPGTCQVDFGNFRAAVGGRTLDLKLLVATLPHSNDRQCVALMSQRSECLCAGLLEIFRRWGRAPAAKVLDNATEAGRMVRGEVTESRLFSQFRAHYRFESRYCNPYSGNEKGSVENAVGFLRRNLLVPVPAFGTLPELNAFLAEGCASGLATLMWTVPGGAQETGGPYMRDPRHPRHFTDEFKRQIVDLYNAGKPKREIMDEYDLGKSTVERWIKSINATGSPRAADNRTPEQNRILELERENRRLRMEVDVLKQAALIYARK